MLWGGRRYDFQLGSERDLRRCETLRMFSSRYDGFRRMIDTGRFSTGRHFEPNDETLRALYGLLTR